MLLAAPASAASSLSAPGGLAPNSATAPQKDPVLSWNVVSGASGYEVELSKSHDWSDPSTEVPLPGDGASTTNSYVLPQTLSHGTYFWRVRAENSSTTGDWSSDQTTPAGSVAQVVKAWDDAPSTTASTPSIDTTLTQSGIASYPWRFAWTPIQDASTYEIEFSIYPTYDSNPTSAKFFDGVTTVDCLTENTSFTPYATVAVPDAGVDGCDFGSFDTNNEPVYWRVRGVDDSQTADLQEGDTTTLECFGTPNNETDTFPNPNASTPRALGTPTSTGQECSDWSATKQVDYWVGGAGGVAASSLGNVSGVQIENCGSPVSGVYGCNGMPEIAWQPVANADQYNVTIADDSHFTEDEHVYQTPFLSLTPRDVIPDYTAGKGYYLAVRACTGGDGSDNTGGCTLADVINFTVQTPKPTNLTQTAVNGGERLSWTDLLADYNTAQTGGTAAEALDYTVQVAKATDPSFDHPVISQTADASCDSKVFTCYNPNGSTTAPATDSVVVSPAASGSYLWRVIPFNQSSLADPAAYSASPFTVDLTKPMFGFRTHSGFAVNSSLTIVSSEPVVTPVNTSTLQVVPEGASLSNAVPGTIHQGANNQTWVFVPHHPLATGGTYVLSVDSSVVDDNGNSAIVGGKAIRATTVAKDSSKGWTYSAGWHRHAASGARSGSYESARAGRTASLVVAGDQAVLYGCKSPHMGSISVTVAGHSQTISEHQSFTRCGVQLWSKALPKGEQTITVRVAHGVGNIDEVKVS